MDNKTNDFVPGLLDAQELKTVGPKMARANPLMGLLGEMMNPPALNVGATPDMDAAFAAQDRMNFKNTLLDNAKKAIRVPDSDALIHYGNVGDLRLQSEYAPVEELIEIDLDDLNPGMIDQIDFDLVNEFSKRPDSPPVEVHEDQGEFEIYDGHHRVEAARQRGDKTIKAWVSRVNPETGVFYNFNDYPNLID